MTTSTRTRVTATVTAGTAVAASITSPAAIAASVGSQTYRTPDPYAGPYEVTPTEEEQTLPTSGLTMTADVVVRPIPSNYGLISYDGAGIRVS